MGPECLRASVSAHAASTQHLDKNVPATEQYNPSTNTMFPFDAERTVELFLGLYAVLVNLAYASFDAFSFSPQQVRTHDIDCFGLNMDPVVLDLVKNLPYLRGRYGFTIAPGMKSDDLINDFCYAQHPIEWQQGGGMNMWRGGVCVWTDGQDGWASGWLILDTRKGMLVNVIIFLP